MRIGELERKERQLGIMIFSSEGWEESLVFLDTFMGLSFCKVLFYPSQSIVRIIIYVYISIGGV